MLLALMACTTSSSRAPPLTLYLASSLMPLKNLLEQGAAGKFSLNLVFQSSSLIAQQITQGAPCDAAIVADERWRDYLLKKEVVDDEGSIVAHNHLILASLNATAAADDVGSFFRNLGSEKIIIGDPAVCPLGTFSKEALTALGVFESLRPNFIMAHNAQNARLLLSSGVAPYAILYSSDAGAAIRRVATIDPKLHKPISYPFLRCRGVAKQRSDALYNLVFSPEVKAALLARGFEPPS